MASSSGERMTHKPPQGIDAALSYCARCNCSRYRNVEGKCEVCALYQAQRADPRKDLALEAKLEEAKWWYETHIRPWRADDLDMEDVAQKRIAELEQRLAEMRGAKR